MNHREYIKTVPGSDTAVLMIHGIAGTPDHFDDLLPLIPETWSVYNILLDGHGGTVAEFGRSSMEKWTTQVSARLEKLLAQYRQVMIVAHSMGTLFAIQAAVRHPDRISGLFLLAVPLRPFVRLRTVAASVKLMLGIAGRDQTAMAMKNDSSVALEPGVWKYLSWIPRLVELLREIRLTRRYLSRLTVPAIAVQSGCDELVSSCSCKDLEENPCIKVIRMPNAGHFGYGTTDKAVLLAQFAGWIDKQRR